MENSVNLNRKLRIGLQPDYGDNFYFNVSNMAQAYYATNFLSGFHGSNHKSVIKELQDNFPSLNIFEEILKQKFNTYLVEKSVDKKFLCKSPVVGIEVFAQSEDMPPDWYMWCMQTDSYYYDVLKNYIADIKIDAPAFWQDVLKADVGDYFYFQ